MKKQILFLSLLAVLGLTACGDTNNGGNNGDSSTKDPSVVYNPSGTELTADEVTTRLNEINNKYKSESFVSPTKAKIYGGLLEESKKQTIEASGISMSMAYDSEVKGGISGNQFLLEQKTTVTTSANVQGVSDVTITSYSQSGLTTYENQNVMFAYATADSYTAKQYSVVSDETTAYDMLYYGFYGAYVEASSSGLIYKVSSGYSTGDDNLFVVFSIFTSVDSVTVNGTYKVEFNNDLITYAYVEASASSSMMSALTIKEQFFIDYNSSMTGTIPTIDSTWTKN